MDRAVNWPLRQGSLSLYRKSDTLKSALAQNGLIAILRGVELDGVEAIDKALYRAGLRVIEVPLNLPDFYTSIRTLHIT